MPVDQPAPGEDGGGAGTPEAPEAPEAAGEPPAAGTTGPTEIYQNEFAMVEVCRYETETGARLRITDLATGAQVLLDPIELESLTRWKHEDFAPLVDPSDLVSTAEPDPDQV